MYINTNTRNGRLLIQYNHSRSDESYFESCVEIPLFSYYRLDLVSQLKVEQMYLGLEQVSLSLIG